MKFKLILGVFISILLSMMNTYSRALHHISMKDVKQKHQENKMKKNISEEIRKAFLKELSSINSPEFSNWREELSEGMTTSDVFTTTYPAVGEVDLNYPSWNALSGYNYTISGGTATITNGGVPGPETGIAASFDTSLYDTLVLDIGFSGDTILGVFPSGSESALLVTSTPGSYSISVPQSKNQILVFLSATLSVGTVTISNLRFQRRTPLNVIVPLDSPDASAFIRTSPIMANLSPEERKQKLKEMLEASDEYVMNVFGSDFPGMSAVPAGESGDTPGVEIAQVQPIEPAQQRRGATGVGVPDTKEVYGPRPPMPGTMNYPPEWTKVKNA